MKTSTFKPHLILELEVCGCNSPVPSNEVSLFKTFGAVFRTNVYLHFPKSRLNWARVTTQVIYIPSVFKHNLLSASKYDFHFAIHTTKISPVTGDMGNNLNKDAYLMASRCKTDGKEDRNHNGCIAEPLSFPLRFANKCYFRAATVCSIFFLSALSERPRCVTESGPARPDCPSAQLLPARQFESIMQTNTSR